ncbi:MAG: hypothetical protein GY856_35770 [bacterium]|nr:hypothetical protein [bacterium]
MASKCTGCAQCWTQCPDSAIPGVVNSVNEVLGAAIKTAAEGNGRSFDRLRQVVQPLAKESRAIMREKPFTTFADVFAEAYAKVIGKLAPDAERKAVLDAEYEAVHALVADFPLAKTAPFFDLPEKNEKDSGGLLSVTVNPVTCKGCNLCVEVCPDEALITVKQDDAMGEKLRRNQRLWENLPDTDDRYINIPDLEEGIGVLSSMLLKKAVYQCMFGGDGSCMGCGEKTAMHLVLSAVNALMMPRVKRQVERLDDLIARLDEQCRKVLAADVDLDAVVSAGGGQVDVALDGETQALVERINKMIHDLRDLRWRYTEGPSGHGRAVCGFTNATGCSSVWGSTYPYNPYPFPWVNHLFQDAPSVAIGIFEGHMRKMGDGFVAVRRAELELAGEYDPAEHDPFFSKFDWHQFNDEEFGLCPPIFAVGGDGAMMDIGFQNLSRMMASGKPLRAIILDTQVYSNTGGQACTSGFTGQVSDMAAYGAGQHGKEETRKELAMIAMAHRGTYVVQSSQATAAHLLGGVLGGLQSRHPAVFVLHCPCPPEHGIGDAAAVHAAKLALESRAVPLLVYDPDAGGALAECLSLDGNPAQDERWPAYDLKFLNEEDEEATMTLPVTIADWAATETRFKKHFRKVKPDQDLAPFHEYIDLPPDERAEVVPFIYTLDLDRRLQQMSVSSEIVELALERLHYWSQLRQMAGQEVTDDVRDEVQEQLEEEFETRAEALRVEYEAKMAELKARYPQVIGQAFAKLVAQVEATGPDDVEVDLVAAPAVAAPALAAAPAAAAEAAPAPEAAEEEGLVMEPYIDPEGCTACDECTNLNGKMFAYDGNKKAFIKDPKGGKFKDLVVAAERCTAAVIHPGTPLNPKEKDLDKWIKRAERFN